jgi:periplasmic divalent cation tolerance protein
MTVRFAYITCANAEQAAEIGRRLIEERLAACVNILPGMRSIYRWQGEIVTESEAVLIAKTRDELTAALTDRVRALHSYTVPCVVILPVLGGNPAYLEWLLGETSGSASAVV